MTRKSNRRRAGSRRTGGTLIGIGVSTLMACGAEVAGPESYAEDTVVEQSALSSSVQIGTVEVPTGGGNLSVAIFQGNDHVRTIHEIEPVDAGSVAIRWDGLDQYGNEMPVGEYALKALSSRASIVDEGSVGQSADPSNGRAIHSAGTQVVATDGSGNVYGSSVWEESPQHLRSWTSTGDFRWGGMLDLPDGIPTLGAAIAADLDYVYVAGRMPDDSNRIMRISTNHTPIEQTFLPTPWGGQANGYILANETGGNRVFGLSVDSNTLWVSNFGKNKVQRFDKGTGAPLGEFTLDRPHGLAADMLGNVWVTHGTGKVTLFGPSGNQLRQINGLSKPFSVAVGLGNRHLYIGEAGSGQIEEYVLPGDPTLAPTHLATRFGRAKPGRVRNDRLRWPDSVDPNCEERPCRNALGNDGAGGGFAVSPAGRMIVADPINNSVVTYGANGDFLSRRFGTPVVNMPQVNSLVGVNKLLAGFMEFQVEHGAGPTHGQWSLSSNWRPSGFEASARSAFGGSLRRRLSNGRDYIYTFYGGPLVEITQVSEDGKSGRVCAVVGAELVDPVAFDYRPYSGVDSDGDGVVEEEEIVRLDGMTINAWFHGTGLWVDDAGSIYLAQAQELSRLGNWNALLELPLGASQFDAGGNPLYDWNDTFVRLPSTDRFWGKNVRIQPDTGDIYRLGELAGVVESPVFWMGGRTVERHLPNGTSYLLHVSSKSTEGFTCYDVNGNCVASFATAPGGKYFYTALDGNIPATDYPGNVLVKMYTNDGLVVAAGLVGQNNGNESGWVDATLGMSAFRLAGQHYVYTEDGYHGRMIRRRVDGLGTIERFDDTLFDWPPTPTE